MRRERGEKRHKDWKEESFRGIDKREGERKEKRGVAAQHRTAAEK